MSVYAYVCELCQHLFSHHGWSPEDGGDLRTGPYVCRDCGCEVPQNGPTRELPNRAAFDAFISSPFYTGLLDD